MPIYDLNQTYYLWQDIEDVTNRIGLLYSIEKDNGKRFIKSKTTINSIYHWTSEECNNTFNKLIPKIKSLHKDMYSLIEAVYKYNNDNKFNRIILEKTYQNFEEFRLLNNQFKHYSSGEIEINVMPITTLENGQNVIDICCNFKKNNGKIKPIRYPDFIEMFLLFLKDLGLITFK